MERKIKAAFDSVHAEASLKEETKNRIAKKTKGFAKRPAGNFRRAAALAACFVVLLLGAAGYFAYTTPVAAISIDINPSIELTVNRFDRVINATGYNTDGEQVVAELDLKNKNYAAAMNAVLQDDTVASCLEEDGLLEVTLTSGSQETMQQMQDCICAQTSVTAEQIYCTDRREEVEVAHAAGVSFGKYRAFLELQKADPDVTVEEIKTLSMREIRERIAAASGEDEQGGNGYGQGQSSGNGSGNTGNENGNTAGAQNGSGSGKGNQYGKK